MKMDDRLMARTWFYSQPRLAVPECLECDALEIYRLGYTGQYIIEMEIESGLACFAPNHSAVVGTDVAVEILINQSLNDFVNIK